MLSLASLVAIGIGVLQLSIYVPKLSDETPGLVIDEKGIQNNTSYVNMLIPWSAISAISGLDLGYLPRGRYGAPPRHMLKIVIELKEGIDKGFIPESPFHKKNSDPSKIHLNSDILRVRDKALLTLLRDAFEEYKQSTAQP